MTSEAWDLEGLNGRAASVIGVVGAGTMGSGIAQLACKAGARTLLYDPLPEALTRGTQGVLNGLQKEADKGKLTSEQTHEAAERLESVEELEQLSSCELVIEAAPERLDVKHELYGRLSEIVSEQCVLASNTSSLPITAIAAGATHPERVVGMHFFNPAPLMRLVEVVSGLATRPEVAAAVTTLAQDWGKQVVQAAATPGFIVNRVARPYYAEALRLA